MSQTEFLREYYHLLHLVEIQDHIEYEVDAILTHRVRRGKVIYLVKWKGYDDTENTWEPVESLANANELLGELDAGSWR